MMFKGLLVNTALTKFPMIRSNSLADCGLLMLGTFGACVFAFDRARVGETAAVAIFTFPINLKHIKSLIFRKLSKTHAWA